MRGKWRGLSAGTILTLVLTAVVTAGCLFVFAKIQGDNPEARMGAQKVMGLVGDALQGTTPAPVPQSTVRTVTVTLAPAPAPTAAAQPSAPPSSLKADTRRSFSLTVGGILAFESDISDSVYNRTQKSFDYTPVLSSLRPKVDGDLTLVMLPQVVNTADQKYGDALVPAVALDAVKASGFEQVLLNTSHVLDQGIQGVNNTVGALAQKGFVCTGVTAGSAQQHRMIQLNGARIALLCYTDSLTAKGKMARESQPNVMQLFSADQAQRDIAALRGQGADFVMVSVYWARSDTTGVTAAMRNTAAALAEAGADLVLGSHPTRVLPVETVSVSDENGIQRQCLIAYSMGTLLTESRDGYDISGILLQLNVTIDKGRPNFDAIAYTPTYIWRRTVNGKNQYQVVCASDAPPQGMDAKQKEYMSNALKRIRKTLQDSPVEQRN